MDLVKAVALAVLAIVVVALILELVVGFKRGGCKTSFRLFTVILAAAFAVVITVILGKIFITETYISAPKELMPLVHDVAYAFAVPVVALLLFIVLKLIMLIVYAIGVGVIKKGAHAEACNQPTSKQKGLGLLGGVLICLVILGFFALPVKKGVTLYNDYGVHEASIMKLYGMTRGDKLSTTELIAAVDELSDYILNVDYISDDAKVQAINYGITMVNDMIVQSGNAMLGNLSLETYDNIDAHKQQVESVVDVAKALDEIGMLEMVIPSEITENSSTSAKESSKAEGNTAEGNVTESSNPEPDNTELSPEKIIEAISDEKSAQTFVNAISGLENGTEMLANVINETVSEMSNGELKNIIDVETVSKPENKDALVKTLTHAGAFTNLSEEAFMQMDNAEKQDLISELTEIKGYGIIDATTCDTIIEQIKTTMK